MLSTVNPLKQRDLANDYIMKYKLFLIELVPLYVFFFSCYCHATMITLLSRGEKKKTNSGLLQYILINNSIFLMQMVNN